MSPSGQQVVTGHTDGVATIWSTEKPIANKRLHIDTSLAVFPFFGDAGKTLVLATQPTNGRQPRRSDTIKRGIERAPHRSLLKATGVTDADMAKPFIAVCNSYVDIVPGHVHLQAFGRVVKEAVRAAGAVPFEFNTIGVDDGIAMGHIGMRYSLPSRELIADSVEYMCNAHKVDAMICISNCDKITPGMLMAAMRLDIPTIFVSGGPMATGEKKDGEGSCGEGSCGGSV